MSWIPNSEWLTTLEKIGARSGMTLALFGTGGLVAAAYEWPDTPPSGLKWLFAASALLGCSILLARGCISVNGLVERGAARRRREQQRTAELEVEERLQQEVIRRLDIVGEGALNTLNWFVERGEQIFEARLDQPELVTLVTSGLVVRRTGQHSVLHWPHYIPDAVWNELIRRRAENSPQRRFRQTS